MRVFVMDPAACAADVQAQPHPQPPQPPPNRTRVPRAADRAMACASPGQLTAAVAALHMPCSAYDPLASQWRVTPSHQKCDMRGLVFRVKASLRLTKRQLDRSLLGRRPPSAVQEPLARRPNAGPGAGRSPCAAAAGPGGARRAVSAQTCRAAACRARRSAVRCAVRCAAQVAAADRRRADVLVLGARARAVVLRHGDVLTLRLPRFPPRREPDDLKRSRALLPPRGVPLHGRFDAASFVQTFAHRPPLVGVYAGGEVPAPPRPTPPRPAPPRPAPPRASARLLTDRASVLLPCAEEVAV